MPTRTITVQLRQQTPKSETVIFLPKLTGAAGDVVLNKFYKLTTNSSGAGSIDLPVPTTGTIRYDYILPSENGAKSRGNFNLSAGATISLDSLILAGTPASQTTLDYVDAQLDAHESDVNPHPGYATQVALNLKADLTLIKGDYATGWIRIDVNPANGDFVTLVSSNYIFKTFAVGQEVQIGVNIAATLVNLLAKINANVGFTNIATASSDGINTLTFTAKHKGVEANQYKVDTTVLNKITVSGWRLNGGVNCLEKQVTGTPATNSIRLLNNLADNDSILFQGTNYVFKNTPVANTQIQIGLTKAITLGNLFRKLQSSFSTLNSVSDGIDKITLTTVSLGAGNNNVGLATNNATNIQIGAATFTGGSDGIEQLKATGIAIQDLENQVISKLTKSLDYGNAPDNSVLIKNQDGHAEEGRLVVSKASDSFGDSSATVSVKEIYIGDVNNEGTGTLLQMQTASESLRFSTNDGNQLLIQTGSDPFIKGNLLSGMDSCRFMGFTSSGGHPSLTEYPNHKDYGFHDKDNSALFLVFNYHGSVVVIQLT